MSVINFKKEEIVRSDLKVEMIDGDGKVLGGYTISNTENKTTLNVNTVWKKEVMAGKKSLKVRIGVSSGTLVINMESEFTTTHEIDPDETSWFNLDKEQTLKYKLINDGNVSSSVEV